MIVKLFFDKKSIPDFSALVGSYSPSEFASPFRSTVPHLSFWSDVRSRFLTLAPQLGISIPDALAAHYEFRVDPKKGKGKASHTDLMLCWADSCMAIEAKYTEPAYQTVNEWLEEKKWSDNRTQVLHGWIDYIHSVAGAIEMDAFLDLPYQLVHRVASACSIKATQRWVLYECFNLFPDSEKYYSGQLLQLASLLRNASSIQLCFTNVAMRATPEYLAVQERWRSGERDLKEEVCQGLLHDSLIAFGSSEVINLTKIAKQ